MNRFEPFEQRGATYEFVRSYNASGYNHNAYIAKGLHNMKFTELMKITMLSKIACLKKADKEADTTMMAIERDEDYVDEFKTCVKDTTAEVLAERQNRVAAHLEKGGNALQIDVPEDDKVYEGLLDGVKLLELKEHDDDLYDAFKASLSTKYGGGAAAGEDDE